MYPLKYHLLHYEKSLRILRFFCSVLDRKSSRFFPLPSNGRGFKRDRFCNLLISFYRSCGNGLGYMVKSRSSVSETSDPDSEKIVSRFGLLEDSRIWNRFLDRKFWVRFYLDSRIPFILHKEMQTRKEKKNLS